MALLDVSVEKEISWDFESCILKNFRVEGSCEYPPQDCNTPCNSATQKQNFVMNVSACDIEDVCRKLAESGLARTVKTIHVFNQPLFKDQPLIDPNAAPDCLIDVTPVIAGCVACCDLLIDEENVQRSGIRTWAMDAFSYDITGKIIINGTDTNNVIPFAPLEIFHLDEEIFEVDSGVDVEIVSTGVTFSSTPVDAIVLTVASVNLPSCCSVPIPALLGLKHNLSDLLALNRFLLRNGLTLNDVNLQYRPRLNVWQANHHLTGFSAVTQGNETWDLTYEFACTDEVGGVQSSTNFWKFALTVRRRLPVQDDVVRLLAFFDLSLVCTSGRLFDGFSFTYDFRKLSSNPVASKSVFYDEVGLFTASSSLSELAFAISVAGTAKPQFFDYSLEEQKSATENL